MKVWHAMFLVVTACASNPSRAKVPQTPKCKTMLAELRAIGGRGPPIDVAIHFQPGRCIDGDARHVSVVVDQLPKKTVELPCWHDQRLEDLRIQAPAPTFEGGTFAVEEGTHSVMVIDEDTKISDREDFTVPHVEVSGDEILVGNFIDVWIGTDAVSVRGPMAVRTPGL